MNGRMVKVLRDSITRIEDMQDGFLCGLDRAVPCILHLENRVNEKLVVTALLEGPKHRTNSAQSKEYFEDHQGTQEIIEKQEEAQGLPPNRLHSLQKSYRDKAQKYWTYLNQIRRPDPSNQL